jgi:hypothetical protein
MKTQTDASISCSGPDCPVCKIYRDRINAPIRGFDYYIDAASKAEQRSNLLWQCVNAYIRGVLQQCQKDGKTLIDAVEIIRKSAGPKKKNEPTSMMNLRIAARQIETGQDLVLI